MTAFSGQLTNGKGGTGVDSSGSTGIAHVVAGSWTFSAVVEADITLADNTTNNVSATAHGFAPKFPNNTTTFLRGDGTYVAPATMTATVGGLVPTPPNNTTTFLRGDGTFASPAGGASTWDAIGAAAGSATTANGTNNIVYNTAPTADTKVAWTFGETSAATNGTSTSGVPNQVLLKLATLAASTQSPLSIFVRGNHLCSVSPSTTQLLFAASSSTPAIAVATQTNTGIAFNIANVDFWIGGTQSYSFTTTVLGTPLGSGSAPIIRSLSEFSTGIFFASNNVMGVGDTTAGEIARFTGGTNTRRFGLTAMVFANLGTPADGSMCFCSDCDPPISVINTCASVGTKTGAFAFRVNGAWNCVG